MLSAGLRLFVVMFSSLLLGFAASSAVAQTSVDTSLSPGQSVSVQDIQEKGAHAVVTDVTEQVISVIQSNKATLANQPAVYFKKVDEVLEPVVAFDYIAKIVMSKYYKSATKQQREAFAAAFRSGMVETIAKGMANYADSAITVRQPEGGVSQERKIEVLQDVKGADGNHVVSYTMAKNKAGQWKLINVVLNGVNLGKSFRDQYAQAMRQSNNQYSVVAANWGKSE